MTGLTANNINYLFVSSRAQNSTYRYMAPGITSRYHYISFTGASQTRDIALTPENYIWVATDWSSMPLRLYDYNDQWLDTIYDDLIPAARGVTMDSDGYLWVSDHENDKIYKIDLSEGVEPGSGLQSLALLPSGNPFTGSVTITSTGYIGSVDLDVFDVTGRRVESHSSQAESTEIGRDLPSGTYMVRATDESGASACLELLKI